MRKRIKEPPPEFFRFQRFYNFAGVEAEACCVCNKKIHTGIHDLMENKIYCLRHADEDGPTDGRLADYEIEPAEYWRDGQSGFTPKS